MENEIPAFINLNKMHDSHIKTLNIHCKNHYQIIDSFKMQLININIRESMLSNIDSEIYKYNLNLLEFITKITCNIFVA